MLKYLTHVQPLTMIAVLFAVVVARGTPHAVRVGPNVCVSAAHPADTHYEVVVTADPHDPSRLVAGSIIYPRIAATYGTIVYQSADGGAHWAPSLELPDLDHTGDPAVTFAPDSVAYYVASSLPTSGERRLLLFRYSDGLSFL